MSELYKALAHIHAIRGQVARGSEFRGYGPGTVAATGLLAGGAAVLQSVVLRGPGEQLYGYLGIWVSTAALACCSPGCRPSAARAGSTVGSPGR